MRQLVDIHALRLFKDLCKALCVKITRPGGNLVRVFLLEFFFCPISSIAWKLVAENWKNSMGIQFISLRNSTNKTLNSGLSYRRLKVSWLCKFSFTERVVHRVVSISISSIQWLSLRTVVRTFPVKESALV